MLKLFNIYTNIIIDDVYNNDNDECDDDRMIERMIDRWIDK